MRQKQQTKMNLTRRTLFAAALAPVVTSAATLTNTKKIIPIVNTTTNPKLIFNRVDAGWDTGVIFSFSKTQETQDRYNDMFLILNNSWLNLHMCRILHHYCFDNKLHIIATPHEKDFDMLTKHWITSYYVSSEFCTKYNLKTA